MSLQDIRECFELLSSQNITPFEYAKIKFQRFSGIYIFGAGWIGRCLYDYLVKSGIEVVGFCDNDESKWGKVIYRGKRCIGLNSIDVLDDTICIIVATNRYLEILPQLTNVGNYEVFTEANISRYADGYIENILQHKREIEHAYELCNDEISKHTFITMLQQYTTPSLFHRRWEKVYNQDEQYFPKKVIYLNDNENFVDCGAYDGDSLLRFLEQVNYEFSTIYLFELGEKNFTLLNRMIADFPIAIKSKIYSYNIGVWNKKERTVYDNTRRDASNVTGLGDNEYNAYAKLDTLDHILERKRVSYIKMDIEGAELNALKGAQKLIKREKPKLAISMYHKQEDL